MSNNESRPPVLECEHGARHVASEIQLVEPKEVLLGEGERAMGVRRTLPNLKRSFVGAWCFVDHYGPDRVATTGGMDVAPHPHTSLQTLSWLFDGEIEHRDSGGAHALVRPGEVNLMTAGHGIAHSEVTTPGTTLLHGVQLWVVLPEAEKDRPRAFQHYRPDVVDGAEGRMRVLVGSLAGVTSPVRTETRLLGAEIVLRPRTTWEMAVDPGYEHGLLVDTGIVEMDGVRLDRSTLGVRDAGLAHLRISNPTDAPARVLLLGGEPFEEGIVMWWNFIGRSHDDIVRLRAEWQAESERFGQVPGYAGAMRRLEAPPIPALRLKRRFRHGRQ